MDDDKQEKSVIAKMVDKINDVVETIANTASNAAAHAMESNAEKFAGRTGEQLSLVQAADAAAPVVSPVPTTPKPDPELAIARSQYMEEVVATAAAPKRRAVKAKVSTGKAAGKPASKTAKKSANKPARRSVNKPPKQSAAKSKKAAKKPQPAKLSARQPNHHRTRRRRKRPRGRSAREHDGLKLNYFVAARSIDGLVSRTRCIAEPGPKIAKTTPCKVEMGPHTIRKRKI